MMQTTMSRDTSDAHYIITSHTKEGIYINGVLYSGHILLSPYQLIESSPLPATTAAISAWLGQLQDTPAVIIFATGEKTQFLPTEIQHIFLQAGIGIEMMTTAAACRTYNVLAHEGRKVALVL